MSCLNRLRKPNKWKSYLDSEVRLVDTHSLVNGSTTDVAQ